MNKQKTQTGFSIVELLVVIIVIGILASIVMLSYSGIQNSAHDSAVKSDIGQIGEQIVLYGLDNGGLYPANATELGTADISATKDSYSTGTNAFAYCSDNTTTPEKFAVGGVSKSGKGYYYSSANEKVQAVTSSSNPAWPSSATVASVCSTATYLNQGTVPFSVRGHTAPSSWQTWIK